MVFIWPTKQEGKAFNMNDLRVNHVFTSAGGGNQNECMVINED